LRNIVQAGARCQGLFSHSLFEKSPSTAEGRIEELKKGKQIGERTRKVHTDGYDQTPVLTGKGPSNRQAQPMFLRSAERRFSVL
jgi:hypothetical protein